MQGVAIEWELYQRTSSAFVLGLVGLVQVLPVIVLTLPAGHVADMEEYQISITFYTSHTNTRIRAYQPSDLDAIVQLWYDTWHQTFPHLQHPYPYSVWKKRFQHELAVSGSIWLAEIHALIVGFIVILPDKQFIDQLFVDANYQSQGIGAALLNQAKTICPQGLSLYTLRENVRARSFYERHGFRAGKLSVNSFNGQPNIEYYWNP